MTGVVGWLWLCWANDWREVGGGVRIVSNLGG